MYNQSYEQYMRDVLGYNNSQTNFSTYPMNNYNIYQDDTSFTNNFQNMYVQDNNLETYYPDIYKVIYPMVTKTCNQISEPITKEMIETMTNTIYINLEAEENIQVKVQTTQNRNADVRNQNNKEQKETRHQDNLMKDLIKIILIKELTKSNMMSPPYISPRPPMPGIPRPVYQGSRPLY